jgi:hypothetical protein
VGGDWRRGFDYAWQATDPDPDEGPGLTWRQLTPRHWSGTWDSKIRGTVTRDGDGWVAYLRLEDPPGPSPITTVGRFALRDKLSSRGPVGGRGFPGVSRGAGALATTSPRRRAA